MFSSLPSASKIYVSSCKQRQKSLNSAKKKRKKLVTSTSTPVRLHDEETLVSSSTVQKDSASLLSFTSHEESFEVELNSARENKTLCVSENNDIKLLRTENSFETEAVNEINVIKDAPQLNSDTNHEAYVSDFNEFIESELNLDVEDNAETSSNTLNEDCGITPSNLIESTLYTDMSPTKCTLQATNENSVPFEESSDLALECLKNNESNPVIEITVEETENEQKILIMSASTNNESCQTNQQLTFPTLIIETSVTCEEDKNVPENSNMQLDECRGLLGENINSDLLDSSSVRSDCCMSTEIYHVHVDNSEHSSLDETDSSHNVDCRIQSPQQSEVSCTESIMYDKNVSQTESPFQSCSTLEREASEKIVFSNTSQEVISHSNNFEEKTLDASHSFIDLHKVNSGEVLIRSISLPDKLSNCKIIEPFDQKIPDPEKSYSIARNTVNKSKISLNKCTSTSDISAALSDNCTDLFDIDSHSKHKKDVATTPLKTQNFAPMTENKSVSTSFKDSAASIMKVLPPVGVVHARARSYIFGSVGSTGSLLGTEELSRLFPDNQVTVFVGTWNMNGHNPPDNLDDFLLPLDVSCVPDIYAIGIQESMQSRSEWEILLQTTLGPSHVLFTATTFGVLHLSIFMRRDLIWFCSEPEEANIATRPGSMIKTKGAVAICFTFFGTSFLFVNSHLTAHEQKMKERLSDYEKICSALDLPKQIPLKPHQRGKDVTSRFDCVFWSGDLNFRVMQDRPSVLSIVEEIKRPEPSCNLLMKHDQLSLAMAKGMAFHGFDEGVINFIPSYKFDVGTSSFDSTKQRVPSYTDRILYRSREKSSIKCVHYNAVPEIVTSDHKPVLAIFNVSLKPGRDNIPLAAGLFKRDIYLEAIKRRARQLGVTSNHKQSTVCSVM